MFAKGKRLAALLLFGVFAGIAPLALPANAGTVCTNPVDGEPLTTGTPADFLTGCAPEEAPPAANFVVRAGARVPAGHVEAPYEYTKYYPSVLQVRPNQTVRWDFLGFHSVTFLPGDVGANSPQGYPNFLRGDAPLLSVNEQWAYKTTPNGCDGTSVKPCEINGNGPFVSSGVPLFSGGPFYTKITAAAGKTLFYRCVVHPAMKGGIQVVSTTPPTQSQLDSQTATQVALDTAAADKLVKDDSEIQPQPDPATGKKLWTVKVGDTTPDNSVTVLGFLPQRLVIGAGDKVNFHNPGQEFHTVTFPRQINGGFGFPPEPVPGQSLGVYPSNIGAAPFPTAVENPAPVPYGMGGLGLFPACEQPTSPVPAPPAPATIEIPAPFAPIVGCPNTGNNPEIKVMPWMSEDHQAPMSLVATPATYHDSGILVPQGAPVWQSAKPAPATGSFESDFEAVFPVSPVGFEYACNIHPGFMRGSISVAGLPVDVKVTPPSATTPPGPDPVGKSVSVTLPKVEGAGDPQGGQTVTVTPPGVSTSGTGPVPSSATVTAPKVDGADQHQGGQRVKVTTPTASADPGTASANATLPKVEGDITSQGGQNIKVTGPKASPAAGPGVTGLSSVSVTPPKVEVTGQPTVGADPITLLLPTVVQNPDGSTTITVYLPTNGQPITVTIPKLT